MGSIYTEFKNSAEQRPHHPAIQFIEKGKVKNWSYEALDRRVQAFARGLRDLGYGKGDTVAMVSTNAPQWPVVDLALSREGMILVPIHTTLSKEQMLDILRQSDAQVLVLGTGVGAGVKALLAELPKTIKTVIFYQSKQIGEKKTSGPRCLSVEKIMELGRAPEAKKKFSKSPEVHRDDTCVIIFTSGTTGAMKGVELTQQNIVHNAWQANKMLVCYPDEIVFSILPLSHAFERVAGLILPLFLGNTVAFGRGLDSMLQDIQLIRPVRMDVVPRLLEKMYEGIENKVHRKSPLLYRVFNYGIGTSETFKQLLRSRSLLTPFYLLPDQVFNLVFYRKIKKQFGGRFKRFICGGAPLDPRAAFFFDAMGFDVLEGYGLTECSPVVTVNPGARPKIGTVGRVIDGVEIKIGDNKEILVRGKNLMRGYWKKAKLTAEVIDSQGWFHTGDQGAIDAEGYLSVTGRIKDLLVTSYGKNIIPNIVEKAIEGSPYISQSMVYGHGRSFLVALIIPDTTRLQAKAKAMGWNFNSWEELCRNQETYNFLEKEITKHSTSLARFERIKNFCIIPREFSQEEDLLTPTLKLKRTKIVERYQKELESLY